MPPRRPFEGATEKGPLHSSGAPASLLGCICLHPSPCRSNSCPPTPSSATLDSHWPHISSATEQTLLSLLFKASFQFDTFPTHECLKRMQLCTALCLLASSSLNTPPYSPLFMRLSVVDLMLMLVTVWFQHIFFVPRLTSQLPLSLPPGAHLDVLFLGLLL